MPGMTDGGEGIMEETLREAEYSMTSTGLLVVQGA